MQTKFIIVVAVKLNVNIWLFAMLHGWAVLQKKYTFSERNPNPGLAGIGLGLGCGVTLPKERGKYSSSPV